MKNDKDLHNAIINSCLDDSTKVICYLEEQQQKQKKYNCFMLIVTLLGAIGSLIAAITGILLFIQ